MKVRFCPFLGLDTDPDTRMNFPSARNYCQRATPPVGVNLAYQSTHCLTSNHLRCPMTAMKTPGALPPALSAIPTATRGRNMFLTGVAVVLLTAVFLFFWWQQALPAIPAPSATDYLVVTQPAATHSSLPSIEPSPLPSNTPIPPTDTEPLPTPTDQSPAAEPPTDTPRPTTTTVACNRPPAGWVQYTVQAGDTLYQISLQFGVSVQQLQAANCLGDASLIHTGDKLFVPNIPTRTVPPHSPTPELTTPVATEIPPTTTETPAFITEQPTPSPQP